MMTRQRKLLFTPPQLSTGGTSLMGTSARFAVDQSFPIEEVLLTVCGVVGNGGAAVFVTNTGNVADKLIGLVKRVTVQVNDGKAPRTVVDFSGAGLIEYAEFVGLNNCREVKAVIVEQNTQVSMPASTPFRIQYRIPIVHPMVRETLRTRMLLPVHVMQQQPIMTVDFAPNSDIFSAFGLAGAGASVTAYLQIVRREMNAALTQTIIDSGGFIASDLIETPFQIPVGTSGEVRFQIPVTGSYAGLMFRQYFNGLAAGRQKTIDQVGEADTFGSESRWRLEAAQDVKNDWRWSQLAAVNQMNQIMPGNITSLGIFPFAALTGAIAQVSLGVSTYLDFLTDGVSKNDVDELGSVLDCNLPSGVKMEIIGSVASAPNSASILYIGGHRFFGDLSKWQKLAA